MTGTGWDLERIAEVKQSGEQTDVKPTKPIAVYFTYISAWATPDGVVNFRPDIYDHYGGGGEPPRSTTPSRRLLGRFAGP